MWALLCCWVSDTRALGDQHPWGGWGVGAQKRKGSDAAPHTVNYRGSLGFGQDSVASLPGNVGTQDVRDMQVWPGM